MEVVNLPHPSSHGVSGGTGRHSTALAPSQGLCGQVGLTLPAQGANSVLGLVPGIVLVFTTCNVDKSIHHHHTLVKTFCWHLHQLVPVSLCIPVADVPAQSLLRKR